MKSATVIPGCTPSSIRPLKRTGAAGPPGMGLQCSRLLSVPAPLSFTSYCLHVPCSGDFSMIFFPPTGGGLLLLVPHSGARKSSLFSWIRLSLRQALCALPKGEGFLSIPARPLHCDWTLSSTCSWSSVGGMFLPHHQQYQISAWYWSIILGPGMEGIFLFFYPVSSAVNHCLCCEFGSVFCPSPRGKQVSYLPFHKKQWICMSLVGDHQLKASTSWEGSL